MYQKRMIAFFFGALFLVSLSSAQTIPTGKLNGTVSETGGLALPGANVIIKSPALILPQMATVTNEKGQYRFSALPSGTYTVTVEIPGMKTLVREGIIVEAGRVTSLDLTLEPSAVEETVVVTGQAPIVDTETTTTSNRFTKDLLENLPRPFTGQSEYMSIFHAAPGIYERHSLGSDERSYKFEVDGVMIQHPVTGGPILEIGYDAISEIMVDTAAHDASQGAVKGAIMQALTKSGGNKFGGEVNFYLREHGLQSDNTEGTPFEGQYVGFRHLYAPTVSLGGPIVKDKLWLFGSLNYHNEKSYAQGYPALSETQIAVDRTVYTPFLKVTWQLSPKDTIMASGYWQGYYRHHRGASLYMTEDATAKEDRGGVLSTLQWTRTFSNDFLFNLKLGYWNFHQYILAKNEASAYYEYTTNVSSVNQGYDYWGNANRVQVNSDATLYVDDWGGNHEFRFGADFELSKDRDGYLGYQDARFDTYDWSADGYKCILVYTWEDTPLYGWIYQGTRRYDNMMRIGAFVQDTWSPLKNLNFNVGLRYDYARGFIPPQVNTSSGQAVVENTITAMTFSSLSPRIGVTFDPLGDGKTAIKAHYGRYYAPMLMTFFWLANPNQERYYYVAFNPDWTVAYDFGAYEPSTNVFDDDITNPYSDEITFGIEREIIQDFSISATFIATWERNLIEDAEMNHLDVAYLKETGELRWTGYNAVEGTDPETGDPITFYELDPESGGYRFYVMNIPGTMRKYKGLQLMLNKRMSRKWAMQASYIWGRGEGLLSTHWNDSHGATGYFDQPNAHINAYGLLDNQRQHHVKFQLVYQAPWGINLTGYYEYGSGSPWTRGLYSETAGLSLYQGNVAILAEPRGSQHLPDLHTLSVRVEKSFRIGSGQLGILADIFNVFNASTVTAMGTLTNVNFNDVLGIVSPRYINLGIRYRF